MFYFHVKCVAEGPQYVAVQHIGSDEVNSWKCAFTVFKQSFETFGVLIVPNSFMPIFVCALFLCFQVGSTFMYAVEFKYGSKLIVFKDNVILSSEDDVFNHSACCNFHYKFLMYHFQAERVCDCYIRIFRKGQEDKKGKRILHFLGTVVSEERDGSVSNRESFQDKIENCLEAMDSPYDRDDIYSTTC